MTAAEAVVVVVVVTCGHNADMMCKCGDINYRVSPLTGSMTLWNGPGVTMVHSLSHTQWKSIDTLCKHKRVCKHSQPYTMKVYRHCKHKRVCKHSQPYTMEVSL